MKMNRKDPVTIMRKKMREQKKKWHEFDQEICQILDILHYKTSLMDGSPSSITSNAQYILESIHEEGGSGTYEYENNFPFFSQIFEFGFN